MLARSTRRRAPGLLWSVSLGVMCVLLAWAPATAQNPTPSFGGKPVSYWVKRLRQKNVEQVNEALKALASIGAPAVPELTAMLRDREYPMRLRAVAVFTQMGPAAAGAVPALIEALNDPASGVVEYKDGSMSFQVADPPAQALHLAIVLSLGVIGEPAIPALLDGLKHGSQLVRVGVAQALELQGKLPSEAALPLLAALKDPHPEVRASARRLLAKQGDAIVPSLVDALERGDDPRSRQGAAAVLGAIGSAGRAGIPALTRALADPDREVRGQAADTLGVIDPLPEPSKAALADALKDKEAQVRLAAAFAVARFGVKEAVPILVDALKDDSTEAAGLLREADRSTIGVQGARGVLSALGQAVDKEGAGRRLKAAQTLGAMGAIAEAAIPALARAADEDASLEVRQAATVALLYIRQR